MAKSKDTINSVSAKPIIFSAEMVHALLEGRKTQTRRVMKVQPPKNEQFRGSYFGICRGVADGFLYFSCNQYEGAPKHPRKWELDGSVGVARDAGFPKEYFCPVAVGDLLWVRETFWIAEYYSYGTTPGGCEISPPSLAYRRGSPVFYAADGNPPNVGNRTYGPDGLRGGAFAAPDPYAVWVKIPSIHMPRWASRLTLRITNTRAERLQDISEADAREEGLRSEGLERHLLWSGRANERPTLPSAKQAFLDHVWTDLYGEHETKSVGANPWVWVYEFEVIRKNVDEVA